MRHSHQGDWHAFHVLIHDVPPPSKMFSRAHKDLLSQKRDEVYFWLKNNCGKAFWYQLQSYEYTTDERPAYWDLCVYIVGDRYASMFKLAWAGVRH